MHPHLFLHHVQCGRHCTGITLCQFDIIDACRWCCTGRRLQQANANANAFAQSFGQGGSAVANALAQAISTNGGTNAWAQASAQAFSSGEAPFSALPDIVVRGVVLPG